MTFSMSYIDLHLNTIDLHMTSFDMHSMEKSLYTTKNDLHNTCTDLPMTYADFHIATNNFHRHFTFENIVKKLHYASKAFINKLLAKKVHNTVHARECQQHHLDFIVPQPLCLPVNH